MDIIGVGFGRTGTTSLKAALRVLGLGPCLHMDDVVADPVLAKEWARMFDLKADRRGQLEKLLRPYRSTVDWPACFFWRDLVSMYPGAKVILSVRDPDVWTKSFSGTLAPLWTSAMDSVAGNEDSNLIEYYRLASRLAIEEFAGNLSDADGLKLRYQEHNESVREEVGGNRLLEFDPASGWNPLCDFLGIESIPSEAFPHANDTATFRQRIKSSLH